MSSADAEDIRGALERLRGAGRRLRHRPARETIDALASVLETWREPDSRVRRALRTEYAAATGFSPAMVEAGMARALAGWTGEALRSLLDRELGGIEALEGSALRNASGFEVTSVVLAGSLPSPTLLGLLASLVLRSPVLAKTSAHDPVTAGLVADSVAAADPELGACIEIVRFSGIDHECVDALLGADCVVASGSDETIASVAARVQPPRRLVSYGHRLSVAAIAADRPADSAARLAEDVALWNQLGCLSPVAVFVADLSPVAVFVADRDPDGAAAFGAELAGALADLEERWPRGRISPRASAAIARERDEAEMRVAGGAPVRLYRGAGSSWTVVAEADARSRPAPLHRFVRVHPIAGVPGLLEALTPVKRQLASVGVGGFAERRSQMVAALSQLGVSRICPLGGMQAPPLSWCHDNQGVLLPLARLSDADL
jgi:hypothetical protein